MCVPVLVLLSSCTSVSAIDLLFLAGSWPQVPFEFFLGSHAQAHGFRSLLLPLKVGVFFPVRFCCQILLLLRFLVRAWFKCVWVLNWPLLPDFFFSARVCRSGCFLSSILCCHRRLAAPVFPLIFSPTRTGICHRFSVLFLEVCLPSSDSADLPVSAAGVSQPWGSCWADLP
jgi:hypothetical protein